MAEIRTVTTLRSKKAEIVASIASYEKRIAQARADLSHINACIALFEATGEPGALWGGDLNRVTSHFVAIFQSFRVVIALARLRPSEPYAPKCLNGYSARFPGSFRAAIAVAARIFPGRGNLSGLPSLS